MTRPMNVIQLKEQQKQFENNIRKDEREKVLKKAYKALKECHYQIWQSPQSFGQKDVVDWEDVEYLFKRLLSKKAGKKK